MTKYVIKKGKVFMGFTGHWVDRESLAVHYSDYSMALQVAESVGGTPVVASTN